MSPPSFTLYEQNKLDASNIKFIFVNIVKSNIKLHYIIIPILVEDVVVVDEVPAVHSKPKA